MSESEALYKLMILYLLKKVNFAMTNSQLQEVFLEKGYTDFFTFQTVLNELIEVNLVSQNSFGRTTRYEITQEGEAALNFFGNKISPAIREDLDTFLRDNKFRMRSEIAVGSECTKMENGEYMAHLVLDEGKNPLIELKMVFPTQKEAEMAADRWENSNQEIYEAIIQKLLG